MAQLDRREPAHQERLPVLGADAISPRSGWCHSDEGQLGLLKGYCHPIRFQNLVDTKKIPDELMKKLPPPEAYAKATVPTIEQGNALKETITKGWDKVVGANIAK